MTMTSERPWMNICKDCGRNIKILNGDLEFSMELHKQSHKPLKSINKETDRNLEYIQGKLGNTSRFKTKYCDDCKGDIEIINNDLSLSLQLHAEKHKIHNAGVHLDHTSSTSSRKKNKNRTKNKAQVETTPSSILDGIFHSMPDALKSHQGFISEKSSSEAICNLCEITVKPIFCVVEHLKTKLHEDNIIRVIKKLMPSELTDQMDFISFYNSNLCCNLCECTIYLCPNNLHKTLVNIFAHNYGKGHLSRKSNRSDWYQTDQPLVVLKTLALSDPLVNENQNFIEHRLSHSYNCILCNKGITYSESDKELLNNLRCHLNSPGHIKSLSAVSLISKWNTLNVVGKENHSFIVAKRSIYCLSCSCPVETNLDQLLTHTRNNTATCRQGEHELVPELLVPPDDQLNHCSHSKVKIFERSVAEATSQQSQTISGERLPSTSTKLHIGNQEVKNPSTPSELTLKNQLNIKKVKKQKKELIKTNEKNTSTLTYVSKENDGYVCTLCKIKLVKGNIKSHIEGKKHKNRLNIDYLNEVLDRLQLTSVEIASNRKFLTENDGQIYCSLCECKIAFSFNVDILKENFVLHFNGSKHVKNKMAKEKSNTSVPNNPSESIKNHSVKESFEEMPIKDVAAVQFTTDTAIKGYLSCRQCHSIIDVGFLREHLEICKISKERLNSFTLASPSYSQLVMCDQNVVQNIGNLSSLLKNISQKSPWQK